MASFTLSLPVQEKGERIDKFIRRFELVAKAYEWDDAKLAKMFPALVCDEKVIAQIEDASDADKAVFSKLKLVLLEFPREDIRKWIKELRVDVRDPEKTAAELGRLVEMAYEASTKQKIKDKIVRDILVDKLPDYLYKETVGKDAASTLYRVLE